MSARDFQRNQFRAYRATNKIHLGKYETDILMNDEFDYDGHTVRYAGMEYGVPQLRGLLGDWFVPIADTTTTYKSKPAGVKVSHATPEARERGDTFSMEEASEEAAVVGTMTEQKQIREAAASGNLDRLAALRSQREQRKAAINLGRVDSNPDAPPPENAADVDPEVEAALMDHTQQTFMQAQPVHSTGGGPKAPLGAGDQDRVAHANAVNQARIAATAEHLMEVDPYKSKAEMGGERHDGTSSQGRPVGKDGKYRVIAQDDGEVVKKYNFSSGASVGSEGISGEMTGTNVMKVGSNLAIQQGKAVASTPQRGHSGAQVVDDHSVKHKPQAVRARQTTQIQSRGNVGIDSILPNGATGDVDVVTTGDDLAELLPGAAVAGVIRKKAADVAPPEASEAEEIAEIVADWNVRRNWQRRVNEAVDFYGDWPGALDAICAKESPKVAAQIRDRLEASKG